MEKSIRIKYLKEYTDYVIVLLSLFSVSPFFSMIVNTFLQIILVFLIWIRLLRGGIFFDHKINFTLFFVFVLLAVQAVLSGGFSYAFLYTPFVTFYIPYLIYKLLGITYFRYFIKTMYFIAIYTFVIWLMQCFIPSFDDYLQKLIVLAMPYSWSAVPRSLLIYTAAWGDSIYNDTLGIYRNSGIFHEPGAYGVFLCLSIVINYFLTGSLFDKKNKVFLLCTLSTLSTTAYFVIFVFLLFYLFSSKQNPALKIMGLLVFLMVSITIYESTDFLKEKVESQYSDQKIAADNNVGRNEAKSGRFYAFFTSVKLFFEHPIFGRGIIYGTSEKATGEMNKDGSYAYGFIGLFSTYGFFFGLYYLLYFYQGLKFLSQKYKILQTMLIGIFIGIQLSLSSQIFILSIPFVMLFILGSQNSNKKLIWK